MFVSFFPNPRMFLLSAFGVFFVALAIWHLAAADLGASLNLIAAVDVAEGERPPFLTNEKLWSYIYIIGSTALFCLHWFFTERHPWYRWSVLGSAVVLVSTYFTVQISLWLNTWFGDFYDLIQQALTNPGENVVTLDEFYALMSTAAYVLFPYVIFLVIIHYFTQHYVFRWRTAMNNYYIKHWDKLRHIEGASQRVQEDAKRFAAIMESLGSSFISAIMTLMAFLPLLWTLSKQVTELPLIGAVQGSFVFLALLSAMFGTVLLALVGIRLPGLEFKNQKVEAAYRKELVFGEEYADRAQPAVVAQLFDDVRKNYYRLYLEYAYFNFFRILYLNSASFVPLVALGPTIVTGAITFGVYGQITRAFSQVENSFQFLANSWTTIIELLSIRKRLMLFEQAIDGDANLDTTQFDDGVAPL